MLTIYADPITINCRKVLAGLHHMGTEFELHRLNFFEGDHLKPDYLAVNANGTVPTATEGDFVLWESNAILQYAADKQGLDSAYPTQLRARADVNRWLLWESSTWFPTCYVFLVENCGKPLLGEEQDPQALAEATERFHKLAGILDQRLASQQWLCGDQPTIADFAVAAPIHLHEWAQVPLSDHANLHRWMTSDVESLPAWEATYVGPGFALERSAS